MPRSARSSAPLTSEPLLNEEQRAALDAALAKKAQEQDIKLNGVPPAPDPTFSKPHLGKNVHHEGIKTKRDLAHDHHLSRRGKGTTRAKKSGAGGRFTWGALVDPIDSDINPAADEGDPNWDSEDDETGLTFIEERSTQIAAYKSAITGLLQEYFSSGDLGEAALSLQELDHPEFSHYFVKKAITMAMDRHDAEREMTSVLLSTFYNEILSPEEMKRGVYDVVASIDDLSLDVPDASDLLALFICRAIADDALPPAFVHKLGSGSHLNNDDDDAVDGDEEQRVSSIEALRTKCEGHLADQHFAERMSRCWGHGAGVKLDETKASIAAMIKEYLSTSGDVNEVRRLLHDLAVPFFHHELVKRALMDGFETQSTMDSVLTLLHQLSESNDISSSQMIKGFQRVADAMDDIELDSPGARSSFAHAVDVGVEQGWLDSSWQPVPTPGSIPSTPSQSIGGASQWANGRGPFHPSVKAFKEASLDITREYFESGDVDEVGRRLDELDEPGFMNIFIKHAVQLSLDRRDREREMISSLLPQLYPHIITPDQASLGFTRLLAAADDLTLDIPDAPRLLTLFLGRAIVDEVLPPKFLADTVAYLIANSAGVGIVKTTGSLLSARHAAERFATCWHARAETPGARATSLAMSELLEEYLKSGDKEEATRCLRDLGGPHFHHELVYLALVAALDTEESGEGGGGGNAAATTTTNNNNEFPSLVLLRDLAASGEVSSTQMRLGFDRVKGDIDDLTLDYVHAGVLVPQFEEKAVKEGWLSTSVAE